MLIVEMSGGGGHKKALGLGSQGLRLMIVIESVYFITFAEEVVPSV